MPVMGLVSTYAADNGVSCDAAAGTQLATGSMTDNGSYGVGAELDNYGMYENILEAAKRNGKKTGIISDGNFIEGVSASFLAHGKSKSEIEEGIIRAEVDVKKENSTSLLNDTLSAFDTLDGEDGFILVIDSVKIEDFVEKNNALDAMEAVYILDEVVAAALNYAENNGETLVVVTAEHETGALYDEKGAMVQVKSYILNSVDDVFKNVGDGKYEVRAFVWQGMLKNPVIKLTVDTIK